MRKRLISVLLASAMALALAACGQSGSSTGTDGGADTSTDEGTGTDASGGSNILVAYFPGQATQRKWLRISRNRPAATCMRFSR